MNLEISPVEKAHKFQHFAMNTWFEIFICHSDFSFARSVAHEAFLLLDSLEADLSRFKENSDVSRINQLKPGESVVVSPETFECLQWAQHLYSFSEGRFDAGAGLLFDFFKGKEKQPPPRFPGSIKNLQLIEQDFRVVCLESPLSIDFGGFGKGFALDKMKDFLQDWQIENALLHGGYSSILAFGETTWPVSVHHPFRKEVLQIISLKNQALGASGLGKGPHIIDPLKVQPVSGRKATWVLADNATLADALSTLCLLLDAADLKVLAEKENFSFDYLLVSENEIMKSANWPKMNYSV